MANLSCNVLRISVVEPKAVDFMPDRGSEALEIEKVDFFMSYFYREMNEAASRLGLKYSHFAVAHGMHHNDNYGSALDVAKLSRVALA